jgi:hypothetical protein
MYTIQQERDEKCELCGKIAELRPYGKNGEFICFPCGMEDEKTTADRFYKITSASYKKEGNA